MENLLFTDRTFITAVVHGTEPSWNIKTLMQAWRENHVDCALLAPGEPRALRKS